MNKYIFLFIVSVFFNSNFIIIIKIINIFLIIFYFNSVNKNRSKFLGNSRGNNFVSFTWSLRGFFFDFITYFSRGKLTWK